MKVLILLLLALPSGAARVSIERRRESREERREERRAPATAPAASPSGARPMPAEASPRRAVTIEPRREMPAPRSFTRSAESIHRGDVAPRRVYWHDQGGRRWGHYVSGGTHWYGFRHGARTYWARPWRGYWWWYDPGYSRWVYWSNGFWWYPGPTLQVYIDGSYRPYEGAPQPTVAPPPAAATVSGSWTSPDGKRLVQVSGPEAEAFLYDNTGPAPVFLKYLGRGVTAVRFYGGTVGQSAQILVDYAGKAAELFDADGRAVGAPVTPDSAPPAPNAEDLPPLPDAAPQ